MQIWINANLFFGAFGWPFFTSVYIVDDLISAFVGFLGVG
jgi:hypothetical protein